MADVAAVLADDALLALVGRGNERPRRTVLAASGCAVGDSAAEGAFGPPGRS